MKNYSDTRNCCDDVLSNIPMSGTDKLHVSVKNSASNLNILSNSYDYSKQDELHMYILERIRVSEDIFIGDYPLQSFKTVTNSPSSIISLSSETIFSGTSEFTEPKLLHLQPTQWNNMVRNRGERNIDESTVESY